jgi:hypothetical protein
MSGLTPAKPVTVDWSATLPPTGMTVADIVGRNPDSSIPESLVEIYPDIVVSVTFSSRVVVPADCVGEYQLRDATSQALISVVACDEAIVEGNVAIVPFSTAGISPRPSGGVLSFETYYIVVTADVVEDFGGNRVFGSSSLGTWTITYGTKARHDQSPPVLAGAAPGDQGLLLPGEPLVLYFSEPVAVPGSFCSPDCIGSAGNVLSAQFAQWGATCASRACDGCSPALRAANPRLEPLPLSCS